MPKGLPRGARPSGRASRPSARPVVQDCLRRAGPRGSPRHSGPPGRSRSSRARTAVLPRHTDTVRQAPAARRRSSRRRIVQGRSTPVNAPILASNGGSCAIMRRGRRRLQPLFAPHLPDADVARSPFGEIPVGGRQPEVTMHGDERAADKRQRPGGCRSWTRRSSPLRRRRRSSRGSSARAATVRRVDAGRVRRPRQRPRIQPLSIGWMRFTLVRKPHDALEVEIARMALAPSRSGGRRASPASGESASSRRRCVMQRSTLACVALGHRS